MRVVDLHHIELLYDLGVYVYLLHLEDGYDLFAQVDGDQVVQGSERLDFLIRL